MPLANSSIGRSEARVAHTFLAEQLFPFPIQTLMYSVPKVAQLAICSL